MLMTYGVTPPPPLLFPYNNVFIFIHSPITPRLTLLLPFHLPLLNHASISIYLSFSLSFSLCLSICLPHSFFSLSLTLFFSLSIAPSLLPSVSFFLSSPLRLPHPASPSNESIALSVRPKHKARDYTVLSPNKSL